MRQRPQQSPYAFERIKFTYITARLQLGSSAESFAYPGRIYIFYTFVVQEMRRTA